jgi:hypothetical protein
MELSAYSGWTGPSSLAGSGGRPPGTPRDRAGQVLHAEFRALIKVIGSVAHLSSAVPVLTCTCLLILHGPGGPLEECRCCRLVLVRRAFRAAPGCHAVRSRARPAAIW